MRLGDTYDLVTDLTRRAMHRGDLCVLAERNPELAVACIDFALDAFDGQQWFADECVHPPNERRQFAFAMKSLPLSRKSAPELECAAARGRRPGASSCS